MTRKTSSSIQWRASIAGRHLCHGRSRSIWTALNRLERVWAHEVRNSRFGAAVVHWVKNGVHHEMEWRP